MKKNTRDYPKRQNFYTGGAAAAMMANVAAESPTVKCTGSATDPDICQRPWLERPYQPSGSSSSTPSGKGGIGSK
jgi:hypothetical protein